VDDREARRKRRCRQRLFRGAGVLLAPADWFSANGALPRDRTSVRESDAHSSVSNTFVASTTIAEAQIFDVIRDSDLARR
jgi:hypothetical protein